MKMKNNKMQSESYVILPFRFERIDGETVFLTNQVGEFLFLSTDMFRKFTRYSLKNTTEEFFNLKSKHMVTDGDIGPVTEMLATKYRTKKRFLSDFTSLHMVVPTLRCNSRCIYCQVSSKPPKEKEYDMDKQTARKIAETIFMSPSDRIKIEFQGGEPLLNIDIVKYIIKYAEKFNVLYKKRIDFVVCTNLTLIDERMLYFFKKHNIVLSVSLDGPRELHNQNRPLRNALNSYDIMANKLQLARSILGMNSISALMTITRSSLSQIRTIIDEYVSNGFNSIFLRPVNPYGRATKYSSDFDYTMEDFFEAYKDALEYIIELNLRGNFLIEEYTCLLLIRIMTPFATGFVDLQSPAGIGIGGVIYNYDGNVYASDEGRMLGEMGDPRFLMGNVSEHTYEEMFNGESLRSIISESCLETAPGCRFCSYMPFCGADPVRSYVEQKDVVGNKTQSTTCKKNRLIIGYLLKLIRKNDDDILDVFWSWITRRSLSEVRIGRVLK